MSRRLQDKKKGVPYGPHNTEKHACWRAPGACNPKADATAGVRAFSRTVRHVLKVLEDPRGREAGGDLVYDMVVHNAVHGQTEGKQGHGGTEARGQPKVSECACGGARIWTRTVHAYKDTYTFACTRTA